MDLITAPPGVNDYFQTRDQLRAQDLGDIGLRNARQAEGANNAIDSGLRDWFKGRGTPPAAAQPAPQAAPQPAPQMDPSSAQQPMIGGPSPIAQIGAGGAPQPSPSPAPQGQPPIAQIGAPDRSDLYSRLAQTPGTGRAIEQMRQQDRGQQTQLLGQMFTRMDAGDVHGARALADSIGFTLPPQAWADVNTLRMIGQAKHFVPMYGDDKERFGQFLQAAMSGANQNGGTPDWRGALQQFPARTRQQLAHDFPRAYGSPNVFGNVTTVDEDGNPISVPFNRRTGEYGDEGVAVAPRRFAPRQPKTVVVKQGDRYVHGVVHPDGTIEPTDQEAAPPRAAAPPAPQFGTTTVLNDQGQPEIRSFDKRTGQAATTLGPAAPKQFAPSFGTTTTQGENGPEVQSFDRRTGQAGTTLGTAPPKQFAPPRPVTPSFAPVITQGPSGPEIRSFDRRTGNIGEEGQPAVPGGGRGGGGGSVFAQRKALYEAAYPDLAAAPPGSPESQRLAAMIDGKLRTDPTDLRRRALSMVLGQKDLMGQPIYKTPEEQQAQAERIIQYLQGGGAPVTPGGSPVPGPVAAGGAPTPGPAQPPAPAPAAAAQGTPDAPFKPTSQPEFDALQSGDFFINPADGRLMRKK